MKGIRETKIRTSEKRELKQKRKGKEITNEGRTLLISAQYC